MPLRESPLPDNLSPISRDSEALFTGGLESAILASNRGIRSQLLARTGLLVAKGVGVFAGLLGIVHGFYETQQGSVAPSGVIITAIGNGCQGFNNCLPAMTVVPNFLTSGILTIILSLLVLLFSAVRIQTRRGPLVLALLSIVLLLVGGGFLPPLLGLVAAGIGSRLRPGSGTMSG